MNKSEYAKFDSSLFPPANRVWSLAELAKIDLKVSCQTAFLDHKYQDEFREFVKNFKAGEEAGRPAKEVHVKVEVKKEKIGVEGKKKKVRGEGKKKKVSGEGKKKKVSVEVKREKVSAVPEEIEEKVFPAALDEPETSNSQNTSIRRSERIRQRQERQQQVQK